MNKCNGISQSTYTIVFIPSKAIYTMKILLRDRERKKEKKRLKFIYMLANDPKTRYFVDKIAFLWIMNDIFRKSFREIFL